MRVSTMLLITPISPNFKGLKCSVFGCFRALQSRKIYGLMSAPIQNSSTNWTGIEAEVAEYSGTNALMQINGSEDGSLSNFIEFGIENNRLAVYTASGAGNWSGQAVTFPCKLRVELSPYYANGRNIRFYYNNTLPSSNSKSHSVFAGWLFLRNLARFISEKPRRRQPLIM